MAGNVQEWNLDFYTSDYVNPCIDCANLTPTSTRVNRGGSFFDSTTFALASFRHMIRPADRYSNLGVRCARTP
jgi:formylglycine-generating enzyme